MAPAAIALAGCGGANVTGSSTSTLIISPGTATIDTNCTGCNGSSSTTGAAYEQFAVSSSGTSSGVKWSVSGGDTLAGAGTINSNGQYTPPSYLSANSVQVTVTATLQSNTSVSASAILTLTPGFLQPLTPENVALGPTGSITLTGYIAEAGGTDGINYALSSTSTGSSGGEGTLSSVNCTRSSQQFTNCSVTYTAPSTLSATGATYIVATVAGNSSSVTSSEVLLNSAGIDSNPAAHQAQLSMPIALGSSGGNNDDFDTNSKDQVTDCCGGTLGSLVQSASGTQYLLSCNHVLARSDQATTGELIVQPGLIDDNCVPYDQGGTETPVGTLSGFVKLDGSGNVDAAIAQVNSGAVNTSGNILELGSLQANGTLASAPPGISSTGGKGKTGTLSMTVAKSGRTTGLTCASIATVDLDVQVSYYSNCAETDAYYTKSFTNQLGIEGNQFSDAGDSGSLVVDASDAEPVGLFFAGGVDQNTGVSEGIANPAADVLSELGSQMGTTYTFVGTADHPVSCLNYGNSTASTAQARPLSNSEMNRTEQAMSAARMLVNPSQGIFGVAMGKSSDHAGEGAVIVYVKGAYVTVPATIAGVRTVVIPASSESVANGSAPVTALESFQPAALSSAALNAAVNVKRQTAKSLMHSNPAFFGVGVGQSYDNPRDAVLVIYVDRRHVPAWLPTAISGLRTRYIIMDRLHVTRSYARGIESHSRCMSHAANSSTQNDPFGIDSGLR